MYDFVILDISFLLFMLIMSNNCICKSMLHNYCTSKWLKVPHPNMIRMTSGCLRFTHIYTLIDIYLIFIRQHIENVRHISSSRVLQFPRKFVSFPFLMVGAHTWESIASFPTRSQFFVSLNKTWRAKFCIWFKLS